MRMRWAAAWAAGFLLSGPLHGYQGGAVGNGGTIAGVVRLRKNPPNVKIRSDRDLEVCDDQIRLDNAVRGKGSSLRGAFVHIADISKGKSVAPSAATLSHRQCLFSPRTLAVTVGTALTLKNEDAVVHGARASADGKPVFNVSLPLKGQSVRRTLEAPGLFRVECERHRWQDAWILVSEHPYAAATDAKGAFSFGEVPPGTYQIRAWHEGWRRVGDEWIGRVEFEPLEQVQTVTVRPGETVRVEFEDLQPVSKPVPAGERKPAPKKAQDK